jgi:colanic acid biosynthesis glycosyl transferase WcaI
MKKRILIHDYAGHPFQIQLSRELAMRGYVVLHLYYGYNNTPKGDLKKRNTDPSNLNIEAIFTKRPIQKYSYIKRWLIDIEYGNLISKKIHAFKPNTVVSANTPLDAQELIYKAVKQQKGRFVFWLQDVNGLASYRLLKKKIPIFGKFIGTYHISLERKLLRSSDKVVLIAKDFKSIMEQWGVRKESLVVIPNWAPLEEVPVHDKNNHWAKQHGLSNKFCFLYTGGLGLKHNPNLLLQLAINFMKIEDIRIVVVSEGPGALWLKERKSEFKLNNLIILDYQPFTDIPFVLASGDVLVAILESDAGLFSVPSKVLTYLCAQRALLLAVPFNNLAAKIVRKNQAGIVVSPNDINAFIKSADILFKSHELRESFAKNARNYAHETFDIHKITDHFEKILR